MKPEFITDLIKNLSLKKVLLLGLGVLVIIFILFAGKIIDLM